MIWQMFLIAFVTWFAWKLLERRKYLQLRAELGLDGPPPSFFLGNLTHIFDVIKTKGMEATPYIHSELEKIYGKTYGFYFGLDLQIVTTDPKLIKEVFISKFSNFIPREKFYINTVYPMVDGLLQVNHEGTKGTGWKEIRSVISAIFTSGKMKKMHLMFHDQVEDLLNVMGAKAREGGGRLDIYGEYQAMTMDMIARCALGQNISCIKDRSNEYYTRARNFVSNIQYQKSIVFRMSLFFPIFKYFRRFSVFGRDENILVDNLSEVIRSREKERKAGTIRPLPDIIDLILTENEKRVQNGDIPLHHDVIVSNAWALFLAGYETTSTALAFVSYLLAKHPEVQSQLHDEIMSTFDADKPVDYERVMKLPYLHAIFAETLRVLPPVTTFTGRRCNKETTIGDGLRVPEGVTILTPVHAVMWNEDNFDKPREFLPERWLGDTKPVWSSTYLPFGIGPRNCVGARFAEMEFKTVLAEVMRRFEIQLDPEHEELKIATGNIIIGPVGGELFVRLKERK